MEYGNIPPNTRADLERQALADLENPSQNPFKIDLAEMSDDQWIQYHFMKSVQMKRIEDLYSARKITITRKQVEAMRADGKLVHKTIVDKENAKANVGKGGFRAAPKSKDRVRTKLYQLVVLFDIDKLVPDYMTKTNGELQDIIKKHGAGLHG